MNSFKFKGAAGAFRVRPGEKTRPVSEFKDRLDVDCVATVFNTDMPTIAIGCKEPNIRRLTPGEGMVPVFVDQAVSVNTQMNLDRGGAAYVGELLEAFVQSTAPSPVFDSGDLETTVLLPKPEPSKPLALTETTSPPPVLEEARTIRDVQAFIDLLEINRLQKAFVFLMANLSGLCVGHWTTPELIAKAASKFNLNKKEVRRLEAMHQISKTSR